MKILIVYHAGAMRNVAEIYKAIAKQRDVQLMVVAPEIFAVEKVYEPSGWLKIESEHESDGYRLIPLPLIDPRRYGLGFQCDQLGNVIRQVKPDIIHVWDEPTSYGLCRVAWLRVANLSKSKVLFYGFQNTPFKLGALGTVVWRSTWTQVAGGAAANSEVFCHLRQAGFPNRRTMERIFWGIPTQLFRPLDRKALKRDLHLEYEHIVGFVGRLVPEKGLACLLAAMVHLPFSIHCVIIGSGPMRGEVELWSQLPNLSGRVHLIEPQPVEELPRYLNCIDVLAVPSLTTNDWKEQYGRVIAEAMACGVPVVGSDSGAIPETAGSAGLIVPEGDVLALAEALRKALFSELGANLAERGLLRAQEELSIHAMSQRLLAFYNRVLEA